MTKKIVLAAVLALLAAPMAAAEERPAPAEKAGKEKRAERQPKQGELKQAVRHCAELKRKVGRTAFEATYPTFRACVLARVQAERANRSEAKADCLAKLDNKAKLGKRAKAKRLAACMAKTAAADSALEREAVVNAAKACAEELAADPAAFRAEYGSSRNLAHAFGKCVSGKAKAKDGDDTAEEREADEEHEADEEDVVDENEDDDEVVEDEADEGERDGE